MKVEEFVDGFAICGDGTSQEVIDYVRSVSGDAPLIVTDPPYGKILDAKWDHWDDSEEAFLSWMIDWTKSWQQLLLPNAAFYVWGGIGTPGFRPFLRYVVSVEKDCMMPLANLITWSKKRAYGVQHNYLFTREELAYFINGPDIKKPRCFNVPLRAEKRAYKGFNKKYPAKSDFYRRTNVWTDITEMMQGKVHDAQKAQRVIEIPIEVHTKEGEWIVDPFAGSGTAAFAARKLCRKFAVVEQDEMCFDKMVARLRVNEPRKV